MTSVQISCPTPSGQPFGIPSTTMAANGTILVGKDVVKQVVVLVLVGDTTMLGDPSPNGAQPATIVGQTWCIDNVTVPLAGSGGSTTDTMYAFGLDALGHQIGDPDKVAFPFQSTGTRFCPGCSGGSGTGELTQRGTLVAAIGGASVLEVTVSDGPVAGIHQVPRRGPLTWEANIAGKSIRLRPLPNHTLLLEVDTTTEVAIPRFEPFSAVFSGSLFGASRSVVVTLA